MPRDKSRNIYSRDDGKGISASILSSNAYTEMPNSEEGSNYGKRKIEGYQI